MSELSMDEVYRYFHNLEAEYASYAKVKEMIVAAKAIQARHDEQIVQLEVVEASIIEAETDLRNLENRAAGLKEEVQANFAQWTAEYAGRKEHAETQLTALRQKYEEDKRVVAAAEDLYAMRQKELESMLVDMEARIEVARVEYDTELKDLEKRKRNAELAIARLVEKLS